MVARIRRSRPIFQRTSTAGNEGVGLITRWLTSSPHCTLDTASNSYLPIWPAAPPVRPDLRARPSCIPPIMVALIDQISRPGLDGPTCLR